MVDNAKYKIFAPAPPFSRGKYGAALRFSILLSFFILFHTILFAQTEPAPASTLPPPPPPIEYFPKAVSKNYKLDTFPPRLLDGGLVYHQIKGGKGKYPASGETVIINYVPFLENGAKIGNPKPEGFPLFFKLGDNQVIKGLDLLLRNLRVGSRVLVRIPPGLAYGAQPFGVIPPNSTLYFYVELLNSHK